MIAADGRRRSVQAADVKGKDWIDKNGCGASPYGRTRRMSGKNAAFGVTLNPKIMPLPAAGRPADIRHPLTSFAGFPLRRGVPYNWNP